MLSQQNSLDVYIEEYYSALDCPKSLAAYLLYRSGEHKQLSELEFNPLHYNDCSSAADSLAASKFLSKSTFLSIQVDLEAAAIQKFREAEESCKATNLRLTQRMKYAEFEPFIMKAIRKIDTVLGEFDSEEFVDSCDWGPGATTSLKRRHATAPTKYQTESDITPLCREFVSDWFSAAYPLWDIQFNVQPFSKLVTVPKNAKTNRTIAIEPGINLWFQKGIGSMIRRRLSRQGIDLNDQRCNQEKARLGSKFNQLATIDFSSASDTISIQTVRELLPNRWYTILNLLRSHASSYKGEPFLLEKFSSMGNGFTFELESLIFYALAIAVCNTKAEEKSISVYGDDVIIPCNLVDSYVSLCAHMGFTVNAEKSYSSSYYRESCGEHYWHGVRIKPIFQKESLNGKANVLKAANNVRRYAHSRNTYGCDSRFRRCWKSLVHLLKGRIPEISEGFGDLGLVLDLEDTKHVTKAKHLVEGFQTRLFAPMAFTFYCESKGLLLSKLKGIGRKREFDVLNFLDPIGLGNLVPLPMKQRHAMVRVLIPRWVDLGPWI